MTNKSKDGQKLPSTLRLQHEGPVGGYTPGEVILADANTPYGSDIPISVFELAKQIADKNSVKVITKDNINFNKIDRYVPDTTKLKTIL